MEPQGILKGTWDLVTRVLNKVSILIAAYNPNDILMNLLGGPGDLVRSCKYHKPN